MVFLYNKERVVCECDKGRVTKRQERECRFRDKGISNGVMRG